MGCEATPGGGPADTHRSLVPRQRLQGCRSSHELLNLVPIANDKEAVTCQLIQQCPWMGKS